MPYPPPDQAITNTFAGQLIGKYPGKCKFSEHGCGVKMKLGDIVEHEKTCEERTVKCPHLRCGLIIQMKHFDDLNNHRDNGSKCMFQYINNKNQPMKKNDTLMRFSLLSFNPQDLIMKPNFSFRILEVFGKKFYVNLLYLPPPRSSFVVTVFLAENEEVSQKYFVNMNISKDTLKYQRNVLSYEGPVLSIDNMGNGGDWIGDDEETVDQSWCFHFEAARPFLEVADEGGNNNRIRNYFPMRINVGCVL